CDGGVNRCPAELVGGLGVDILVVGSALFKKGHDMAREIRLIRALADEGYQYALSDGVAPIPRDRMGAFASLPEHPPAGLIDEIEAGGVRGARRAGNGCVNPDGVRDYHLRVPASAEAFVVGRFSDARTRYVRD